MPLAAMAAACRHAAAGAGPSAVSAVLQSCCQALGAERAFLVRAGSGGTDAPVVLALWTDTTTLSPFPSRSLARQALAPGAALVCRGAFDLDGAAPEESVRALGLRWVVAAPLPPVRAVHIALVVDSRRPPPAPERAADVAEVFSSLLGLLLRSDPRAAGLDPQVRTPVGRSEPFLALMEQARAAAGTRLSVLVTGESGTGKEAIARLVHEASPRCDGPFVSINCAALPEGLLESELFGARRGAFTGADRDREGVFAAASGGTLFLDEIGDMAATTQARLLRTLQEGTVRPLGSSEELPVDVRIVAATHRDVPGLVREGRFRADLFYRIAVLRLHVPALRDRRADIPLLADHLLARLRGEAGIPPVTLSDAARAVLAHQHWPGNVRELEAVLARAALRACDGRIEPRHLDSLVSRGPGGRRGATGGDASDEALERTMVASALQECGGSITLAARRIGWTRQKLYRRVRALGLDQPSPSEPRGTTSSASSTFQ